LFRYCLHRTGNRVHLAAGLTTLIILAAVMIPLFTGILMSSLQLYAYAANTEALSHLVQRAVEYFNQFRPPDEQLTAKEIAVQFSTWLKHSLVEIGDKSLGGVAGTTWGLLKGVFGFLVALVIGCLMYAIALFYFLADGVQLLKATEMLIPVHVDYQRELLSEFSKVVRAVVSATFLAAIGQGLATGIALWFLGFDHTFVLIALATLCALIPLAGTWLVWAPCAVWLVMHGHSLQAAGLAVYGIVFVGFLDNIIRTFVLNSDTKLHPLLAFISVLGGIQAMGLWGVFVGPIVASCLYALVKIFNLELQQLSRDRARSMEAGQAGGNGITAVATISEPPAANPASEPPAP
jgi:predicted PurR-regulated permease PerM